MQRIVFAGTPRFAALQLQALLDADWPVCAVLTQPDRPAGRGRPCTPSPVKCLARTHGLETLQPERLDAAAREALAALAPDLLVVAAYGLLLPAQVLTLPALGCVNVHASLLPRWRGAAPIQRAIIAGDTETGVSIMQMDRGLDTGDVLRQAHCPIEPRDTAQTLHERLALLGARALIETLAALRDRRVRAVPQDPALATHAPRIDKREAEIDWGESAALIARRVRAFVPWPVAYTAMGEQRLRIWDAEALESAPRGTPDAPPGTVLAATGTLEVGTGEGRLRILRVQRPGGRPMAVSDWLNARPTAVGQRLGHARPGAGQRRKDRDDTTPS